MDATVDARYASHDNSTVTTNTMATEATEEAQNLIVEQMLAIVASQTDASTLKTAPTITADDIRRIYHDVHGDPSRVYDDVMTLLAIRAMRLEEHEAAGISSTEAKLQWQELCHGLGLNEYHEIFRIVEAMPEDERDAALSENGGFFQSLLLQLEEEERVDEELEKTMALIQQLEAEDAGQAETDEHPLEQLRRLFPDYKMHVIEDVYEAHGFDLDATATALANIGAVSQVKSFASVLKTNGPTTMWKNPMPGTSSSIANGRPAVESFGQFPVLPAKSKQNKHRHGKHHHELSTVKPTQSPFAAQRKQEALMKKRLEAPNAWNTQATPTNGNGTLETRLTTDLKLERLQRLLPSIDREVIRTTFFMSNGNSEATEASLREIFNIPLPPPPISSQELDDEDLTPATTADSHVEDNPTYTECRSRVDNCWQQLSDRYVAALRSFNRNHHVVATDRVRDITAGRRALREAQHAAAHAFVEAHMTHIRHHQALDLHGLTVVEALRVSREVIDVCRAERIRRCILICGVGNHSINQKARLLIAIQLSLEHRHIAFRKESGTLYIYPLRSTS